MRISRENVTLYRVTCLRHDGTTKYARSLWEWTDDVCKACLFKSHKRAKSVVSKLVNKFRKEQPRPTKGYMEFISSQYIIEEVEIVVINKVYLEKRKPNGTG